MTRKIKVVDVDTTPKNDDGIVVRDSNINEVVVDVPIEPPAPPEPAQVKKPRSTKQKKEVVKPNDDVVVEIPKVEVVEEPEVSEDKGSSPLPKVEVVEEPKVEVVEEPEPKKNIKTVELVECPKCHKKLTERTLKYSHQAVCSAVNPPQPKPKTKTQAKQEEVHQPAEQTIENIQLPQISMRMQRINQRSERYKKLIVNAF